MGPQEANQLIQGHGQKAAEPGTNPDRLAPEPRPLIAHVEQKKDDF